MRNISSLIGLALALIAGPALGGQWSSGGGEVIRDQLNPWFLRNTSFVSYCIDIDEQNFGMSRAEADTNIQTAFLYWRTEFTRGENKLGVATQVFQLLDCTETTDLRFQLGKLTAEQASFVHHPEDYVSLEVRTDYDPVNLKGRGFIYVTPERGPNRIPDNSFFPILPNVWSNGHGLLNLVLAHELGHIFGLSHFGSASNGDVMAEDFPDSVARLGNSELIYSLRPGFFRMVHSELTGSLVNATNRAFFGVPIDDTWLRIVVSKERILVSSGSPSDNQSDFRVLGSATFDGGKELDSAAAISLYVTPAQTALSELIDVPTQVITWAPLRIDEVKYGTYISADGKIRRPIIVHMNPPERFVVFGVIDGTIVSDLLFPY